MSKKVLFLQFRTGPYLKRETTAINHHLSYLKNDLLMINTFDTLEYLPKIINHLDQFSAIILGGSGEVDIAHGQSELEQKIISTTLPLITKIISTDHPTFAICLGLQLIAHHQKAPIEHHPKFKEHGTFLITKTKAAHNDRLFKHLPDRFYVQHGHIEAVTQLPQNATLLATNNTVPIQAFKLKQNIYAVQFHAEMTLKDWLENTKTYIQHNPETGYSLEHINQTFDLHPSPHAFQLMHNFIAMHHPVKHNSQT